MNKATLAILYEQVSSKAVPSDCPEPDLGTSQYAAVRLEKWASGDVKRVILLVGHRVYTADSVYSVLKEITVLPSDDSDHVHIRRAIAEYDTLTGANDAA